jgi:hypothetical protein
MSKNRDKKLQRKIAEQRCRACYQEPAGSCDHIITVGSRPDLGKHPANLWALCFKHHREKEDHGLTEFVFKYNLQDELLNRGFWFCDYTNKWRWGDEDNIVDKV